MVLYGLHHTAGTKQLMISRICDFFPTATSLEDFLLVFYGFYRNAGTNMSNDL